jgi:hypothetical protein
MRDTRKRRELTIHNLLANNSPFSWRSLFSFVIITILSTTLLCVGKIDAANWVELQMWIGGFFITGETAKKFAKKRDEADISNENTDPG